MSANMVLAFFIFSMLWERSSLSSFHIPFSHVFRNPFQDRISMSSAFVNEKIFCGFLGLETKENSGVFEKHFFRLDPGEGKLQYYSDKNEVSCLFCRLWRLFGLWEYYGN